MREVRVPMSRIEFTEDEVRDGLKELGIKSPKYVPMKTLVPLYSEYKTIRMLLPEEVWANYALLGVKDLREQIMLKKAKRAITTEIRRLKDEYKKNKKETEHKTTA